MIFISCIYFPLYLQLQEEMDEFFSAALDPEREVVLYKDYVSVMAVEES